MSRRGHRARTSGRRPAAAALVAVLAAALLSACSGSDEDPPSAATPPPPDVAATGDPVSGIQFVSVDNSAFTGSIASFTLVNTETQERTAAPVHGLGDLTNTFVEVPPGTYAVELPPPAIIPEGSYTVRPFEDGDETVVVGRPTKHEPQQIATVEFGLEETIAPLVIKVADVGPGFVEVEWTDRAEDADEDPVEGYQLRLTEGTEPAAGPSDGTEVVLESGTATTATASGLQPETDFTLTLFATTTEGKQLPFVSASATTGSASQQGGAPPSYALEANTVLPTDLGDLDPQPISDTQIQVDLADADRASTSVVPGVRPAALESGCLVGSPVLVATDVADRSAFYGVIESCGDAIGTQPSASSPDGDQPATRDVSASGSFAAVPAMATSPAPSATTAVINTDVPLGAVFTSLQIDSTINGPCSELADGVPAKVVDGRRCIDDDRDRDGLSDETEAAIGTDPAKADTDRDDLKDGAEVEMYGTDPTHVDTDFDGAPDGTEINLIDSDPLNPNTDGDNCLDSGELTAERAAHRARPVRRREELHRRTPGEVAGRARATAPGVPGGAPSAAVELRGGARVRRTGAASRWRRAEPEQARRSEPGTSWQPWRWRTRRSSASRRGAAWSRSRPSSSRSVISA